MPTYLQAIRVLQTDVCLLDARVRKLQLEMERAVKDQVDNGEINVKTISDGVEEQSENRPSREEIEDFTAKHFDYPGKLSTFIEENKEYLLELYMSEEFMKLAKYSDDVFQYLDGMRVNSI